MGGCAQLLQLDRHLLRHRASCLPPQRSKTESGTQRARQTQPVQAAWKAEPQALNVEGEGHAGTMGRARTLGGGENVAFGAYPSAR